MSGFTSSGDTRIQKKKRKEERNRGEKKFSAPVGAATLVEQPVQGLHCTAHSNTGRVSFPCTSMERAAIISPIACNYILYLYPKNMFL